MPVTKERTVDLAEDARAGAGTAVARHAHFEFGHLRHATWR